MYPEFIAIYVGLGILALLQVGTIVLVIVFQRKSNQKSTPNQFFNQTVPSQPQSSSHSVAFCVGCGTQFDSTLKVCPRCGRPR